MRRKGRRLLAWTYTCGVCLTTYSPGMLREVSTKEADSCAQNNGWHEVPKVGWVCLECFRAGVKEATK